MALIIGLKRCQSMFVFHSMYFCFRQVKIGQRSINWRNIVNCSLRFYFLNNFFCCDTDGDNDGREGDRDGEGDKWTDGGDGDTAIREFTKE